MVEHLRSLSSDPHTKKEKTEELKYNLELQESLRSGNQQEREVSFKLLAKARHSGSRL
jgi:hypothetical protein